MHTAVMLIRSKPGLDLSGFSFAALDQYSRQFHEGLVQGGIDEQIFRSLDPAQRIAGALNLEAKLRNTTLAGTRASDFIRRIGGPDREGPNAIAQDRIYALVDKEMPEKVRREVAQSQTFFELPEWANELFHEGYPVSFKQRVPFGSLQLSFGSKPADGDLLPADIDIDLFTDIGHLGEVVRNELTGVPTDPFTVYVQLFDQRIFPLYLLKA